MSSISQQSHWLAKNRIPCTWSQHVGETPFDGLASQVGWGGGTFVIQSLWIELIRCTIKVLTHWLICLVHWIRVMRGVMQIFFRYIWTHSLLKHPNITQLTKVNASGIRHCKICLLYLPISFFNKALKCISQTCSIASSSLGSGTSRHGCWVLFDIICSRHSISAQTKHVSSTICTDQLKTGKLTLRYQ